MHPSRPLLALAPVLLLVPPAPAQSNTTPGLDLALDALGSLAFQGRQGTWPNGVNGLSVSTTACNVGTVDAPWEAPMDPDHPFIAFLVVAERDGRLVQISDRSYVKHGFNASNSPGCGSCPGGPGTALVVGCSDTYGSSLNANNYYLGPPDEIDPWLGQWDPICSHFDRGEPPVAPPADCDGVRSLTMAMANALGPVGHRIQVLDSQFEDPDNALLAFQGGFIAEGEAESARGDNWGWRTFTASWNGSTYDLSTTTALAVQSVLHAWTGATVASGAAGGLDGRVFVAARATHPGAVWHYEYALHNRDHAGGLDGIRIPLQPGAVVNAAGMRDIDANAQNDWTAAVVGNELVFTGSGNPLEWNTIYNVWFDTDASPGSGSVAVEQASGPGSLSIGALPVPTGALAAPGAAYCTAGTSSAGCQVQMSAAGIPSATLPSGFVVSASPAEGQVNGLFFFGTSGQQANPWGNGTSYQCVVPPVKRAGALTSSGTPGTCNGSFSQDLNAHWTAKPNHNPGAGAVVDIQLWYRDPLSTSNQTTSLSDGYEVTVQP
jgi:hypothetical protein